MSSAHLPDDVCHGTAAHSRLAKLQETVLMLQIAKLNKALESSSVQVGDVLRGVTCTNFVYEVCHAPRTRAILISC